LARGRRPASAHGVVGMTDYGDLPAEYRERDHDQRPAPDAEPAVYATEPEGEVSVEGVAAALAELEGDE